MLARVAALCTVALPTIAAAKTGPRITAKPSVVEVNEATTLTGTGFPADEKIVLKECEAKGWIAPRYPCASKSMTIKTDATGAFTATFAVSSCSGVKKPKHVHKCYIGEYEMGEDGGALIGAAKLTVTP